MTKTRRWRRRVRLKPRARFWNGGGLSDHPPTIAWVADSGPRKASFEHFEGSDSPRPIFIYKIGIIKCNLPGKAVGRIIRYLCPDRLLALRLGVRFGKQAWDWIIFCVEDFYFTPSWFRRRGDAGRRSVFYSVVSDSYLMRLGVPHAPDHQDFNPIRSNVLLQPCPL